MSSMAAPAAGHGIIGLAARLGPTLATPDVLRAFALHCAEPPDGQPVDEVGFGRLLERYDERWNCQPNEATILYRDTIERDQMISLPFPLVADAVAGRIVYLAWTLVFTASTDPTDAVDYTQAGLEGRLRRRGVACLPVQPPRRSARAQPPQQHLSRPARDRRTDRCFASDSGGSAAGGMSLRPAENPPEPPAGAGPA